MVIYQISTNTKFRAYDTDGLPFNSMRLTPLNGVIMSWLTSGTARSTGEELLDLNMNFLRQVTHSDGHNAVTIDTNGDEVMVWTNTNDPLPIPNCNNGIVKVHLADGVQTCLLQLGWNLAVHISAPDGNGTVFVDIENANNIEPGDARWVDYTTRLCR